MQDNDGNDSGYESNEEGGIKGKENAILQRVNNTIADLRNELKSGESFLAGTFVNIARSNKGIIDLKLQDFLAARRSFLEEDPDDEKNKGKDVKSLLASLKAIDKKIAKMEKEGIDSKYFADFKHEVDDYRSEIAEILSTNDGIRALVNKRLVGQLFTDVKIMGMDSNGNPKAIDPEKKKAFFSQITPHIKDIPPELEKAMLSEQNLSQLMSSINKETLKFFAINGDTQPWGVLDDKKITPKNVMKFANSINNILEEMNSKVAVLQVEQTVQEVLQNIKRKMDIPDKQKEKITGQISQALTELAPDDLRKNKGDIISEVTKDIVKRKTLGSSLTRELTISTESLQNISNQLIEKHGKKSEPLTKAASIISSEKISEGRLEKKINTEISLPIISKAIDAVLKEKNAKIKPEQLAKIEKNLSAALSDLDPEYLKSHKDNLTKELTNNLANKGNTSLWNKNFTIDSSKLEKFSMAVKNVEERKSNKFVEEKITQSLFSRAMSDSTLATKLSEFLAENKDAGIKLDPNDMKSITNQQLVELRKINPKSFDKTLFPTTEPTSTELKPTIRKLPAYNKGLKPSATPIALSVKKKTGPSIIR